MHLCYASVGAAFRMLLMTLATFAASSTELAEGLERQLPPTTLSAIRDAVILSHNQVESLEVQYCMSQLSSNPKKEVYHHRHRLAVKGRLRFRDNVHFMGRFPPSADLNHIQQYFTVETFDFFVQHSRAYEVSREAAKLHFPWKVRADTFIDSCGWWPPDDDRSTSETAKVAVHLRFVLTHPEYVLQGKGESVDGHPCYVVEKPGIDRLWLDPDLGYALRKRELYEPTSGSTLERHTMGQFKEFDVPGSLKSVSIWFPMFACLEDLQPDEAGEKTTSEMRVEELKLNQVDESIFRFVPPPGTLVLDRDTNEVIQIPGGRDLLDDSVALAQHLQMIDTGKDYTISPRTSLSAGVALMTVFAALIGVNVFLFVRTRRGSTS